MTEKWIQIISQKALQALLYEVSASPKPGLVDRFNPGAHRDMDFFTFMASGASLANYFSYCVTEGIKYSGQNPKELFKALRNPGIEAEKAMFEATKNVNTHKGLIFSLGIICAAASCCRIETDNVSTEMICKKVSLMTEGICSNELTSLNKKEGLTNGEKLYIKYGLTGIRGEVEKGFPTVRNHSLPVLKKLRANESLHINEILVHTLLHLMAVNEDTNIVARHNLETLEYVQDYAKKVLDAGGALTEDGMEMIRSMDQEFIRKHISPGGSADLLAVTVLFDFLEE